MRRLVVLLVVMLAPVSPAIAGAWPGAPKTSAPRLDQQGPPPAWVESTSQSRWMAFSSYCWTTPTSGSSAAVCADMIPPQSRNDLPSLTVRRGSLLRIHLAFDPKAAHLTLFRGSSFKHYTLPQRRVLTWRVTSSGVASIDVSATPGSAAFLIRLNAH